MSLNPFPGVHLISGPEAGDGSALAALGVELVVLCHQGMVWPHSKTIGAIAVNVEEDGSSPGWLIRGVAKLLADVYGVKTLGLADAFGGLGQASYVLTCAVAEKQGVSFDAAIDLVRGKLPERRDRGGDLAPKADVSDALKAQGRALWP